MTYYCFKTYDNEQILHYRKFHDNLFELIFSVKFVDFFKIL